jgi:hypothetical protein
MMLAFRAGWEAASLRLLSLLVFVLGMLACASAYAAGETGPLPERKLSALFQEDENAPAEPDGEEAQETEEPEEEAREFGLPGFWGSRETAEAKSKAFLPFYYRYKSPDVSIGHYMLLYGHEFRKEESDTYYFLATLFRYTSYEDGGTQVALPWPVLQFYAGPQGFRGRLFPLLWIDAGEEKSHAVVFPLFWHYVTEKTRTTLLVPVYWDIRTPEYRLWHLWPVYGYSKGKSWSQTLVGFPLFRHTYHWNPEKPRGEQPVDREIDLLWPLVKFRHGPLHSQYHIFPFFYGKLYEHDKEDGKTKLHTRYFVVPPVFWYWSNPKAVYWHVWPVGISGSRDGEEKRYDIAFPLLSIHTFKKANLLEISIPFGLALFKYESGPTYIDIRDEDKIFRITGRTRKIRLFPIFGYQSFESEVMDYFTIALHPVFAYSTVTADEKTSTQFSLVGGLVFRHLSKPDELQWQALLGAAGYKRDKDNNKYFNLLWWSCKWEEEETTLQFEPLFYYTEKKDDYDFRVLTGIFGFGRKEKDSYIRLLWFLKL